MGDILGNVAQEFAGSRGADTAGRQPVGRVVSVNGAKVQGILRGRLPIRIGEILRIGTPASSVFGVVGTLAVAEPGVSAADGDRRVFEMELLGEIPAGNGAGPPP